MSFSMEHTAYCILNACQNAARKNPHSQGDFSVWASRDWLYSEETLHEVFLSSIPFLNPLTAQQILATVTLSGMRNGLRWLNCRLS
jgi:hypothetical protein